MSSSRQLQVSASSPVSARVYDVCRCHLVVIAAHLGKDCKHVSRRLGLQESIIACIEHRHERDLRETSYQLLWTCYKNHSSKSTFSRKLRTALMEEGRRDMVKKLEQECSCDTVHVRDNHDDLYDCDPVFRSSSYCSSSCNIL